MDGGTAPVLVTSAFAGSARGIARYLSAPRGMREVDLAREVGVPPWKLRTIRDQSRGWSDAGIARAIRTVAQADADIKGAASDASYTLERMVLTVDRAPRPLLSPGPRHAEGADPAGIDASRAGRLRERRPSS